MKLYYYIFFSFLFCGITLSVVSQDELFEPDSVLQEKGLTIIDEEPVANKVKSVIESPISYNAVDSIAVSMENGQQVVHLYKGGTFKYGSINLEADYISVNFEKKEIYATGLEDTLGNLQGKPHFTEGSEEFDCESLRYNFISGKGFVVNVVTEQQDGFVRSSKAKMMNKDVYCMVDGKYSTCDAEHPHFYLQMTKGKVLRDKAIITGRSYLVLEDFPIYFPFLPYGFIPTMNKTYSSGVIIPSYGEDNNYGFYLRDGGFYWAASDYFDVKITGDIYSNSKWGLNFDTRFKMRYKFSGSLGFNYSHSVTGIRGINQSATPNFGVRFNLNQDAKANPSQTISGSVDFSSVGNSRENEFTDYEKAVSNSKSSSINYRKTFTNTPFSLSANMRVSQNTKDSTVAVTLPSLNLNMKSIYPFRRSKWDGFKIFKDFQFKYSSQFESRLSTKQSLLFTTPYTDWKKGIKHNIPITLPSFKLLKHINVVPSLSYGERWFFNYTDKYWVDGYYVVDNESGLTKWVEGHVEETQKDGFKRNYDYQASLSSSTTLYGLYQMKNPNSKLKAIRHKMSPSLSLNYKPDFSDPRFSFYDMVQVDSLGNYQKYNIFQNAVYSSSSAGESRSLSFGLDNNIEMKLANDKDTTSTEKFKKVAIFDNLSFRGNYNFMADSMKLSTIALNARTKIAGTSINISGTLDPYALDAKGRRYNEYMWNNQNASGLAKLGRITNLNSGFSLSYSSDKLKKKLDQKRKEAKGDDSPEDEDNIPLKYAPFDMPWRISANYSVSYSNPSGKSIWRQSVSLNGGIDLTPKWKSTITSGFDLMAMKMVRTQIGIVRNLHCWTMSFDFVPFGSGKYYNFTIRANASMLKDLKIDKKDLPTY